MLLEEETDKNTFDFDELNTIREKIELMSKFNQIEVLRILHGCKDITLNENKYGIHVNLSDMNNDILEKIKLFISYVNTQETNLNFIETQKENFKNTYFSNDIKDTSIKKSSSSNIKSSVSKKTLKRS